MGFAYAFGGFERFSILVFRILLFVFVFFFLILRGAGNWSDSRGHQTRDFPMICHDRRFFSIGVFSENDTRLKFLLSFLVLFLLLRGG